MGGEGEKIGDPLFKSQSDYHVQSGSPAIDAGIDLGHMVDYDNNPVPRGVAPDIGAYEFQSSSSNPDPLLPPKHLRLISRRLFTGNSQVLHHVN